MKQQQTELCMECRSTPKAQKSGQPVHFMVHESEFNFFAMINMIGIDEIHDSIENLIGLVEDRDWTPKDAQGVSRLLWLKNEFQKLS